MSNQIEYSNDFIDNQAKNSMNIINNNKQYNEWTGIYNDPSSTENNYKLATKPMKYYVNSLNNKSGTENEDLNFTPIGQAQFSAVSNIYDRAVPSNLNRGVSSTYTFPHSTSAYLGSTNNINHFNTDIDLNLKTGINIRPKRSANDLSAIPWNKFGDVSVKEEIVSNAGQFWDNTISNRLNDDIKGLNESMSVESQGKGGNYSLGPYQCGISTRNAMINYQNPGGKSGKELKNN